METTLRRQESHVWLFRDNGKTLAYEIGIAFLALTAVLINIVDVPDNGFLKAINKAVLAIFTADYVVRFLIAQDKRRFFKNNLLDLIAILPFNFIFRAFRVVRLLKVLKLTKTIKALRIFTFSRKFHRGIKKFLETNGFIYMIYITTAIIFLAATLLYLFEKNHTITSFEDAAWLSFSTVTLFGYEGVENLTITGKVISGVLILVGIFFTSMLTSTTFTFFKDQNKEGGENFQERKVDLSDLDDQQFQEILNYTEYIKGKK